MFDHDADSSTLADLLKHRNMRSQLTQQRTHLARLTNQAEALKQKLETSKPANAWQKQHYMDELQQEDSAILADYGSSNDLHESHHMQHMDDVVLAARSPQRQQQLVTKNSKQQPNLTQNERKLVKLLKKVQKEKDKLSAEVEQLLDSQSQLLQQLHQVQTQLEHQQEVPAQPQQPGILQLSSYQPAQCSSPGQQQRLQQHSSPGTCGNNSQSGLQHAKQHVRSSIDSKLDLQLQELQDQIDDLSREQQPVQQSLGVYATGPVPDSAVTGAHSNSSTYGSAGWLSAAGGGQQLEMIADQAETILELKRVITELETQTSTLRTQASKQDNTAAALAECQAKLQERDKQLLELQEQHEQQQELAQTALQEALASARAAEDQSNSFKHQLQQQQAYQDEETKQHQEAVNSLRQQLQQQTDTLSSEVTRLRSERQQLLLQLQKANGHIADLHDELGPALLRGSPSPTRRRPSAAAAGGYSPAGSFDNPNVSRVLWQGSQQQQQQHGGDRDRHLVASVPANGETKLDMQADAGPQQQQQQQQVQQHNHMPVVMQQQDVLQRLQPEPAAARISSSRQHDTLQKQQMLSLAADNARLAVALAESMAGLDLFKQQQRQQQQQGENRDRSSPTRSSSPFADVPDNQLVAAAAHWDPQQQQRLQLLVSQLEMVQDQVTAAAALSQQQQQQFQQQQAEVLQLKQELASVQQECVLLQREHLQRTQATDVAAAQAAAAPNISQVSQDNHHLRLQLLSQAEQLYAAEAQLAAQQSELVDRIVVEQIDARNRALLQEVLRLVTENTDLKQHQQLLRADSPAAAAPAKRSSLITVPDLLTVLPPFQHQEQQQQQQVEVSPISPRLAAAVAAANAHSSSSSGRVTSRQQSLSRLASSSSAPVHRPSGLSAAAAAAVAAAELDAEQSSRKPALSTGGSMRVRWSEYQLATPTEADAAIGQLPLSPHRSSRPNILLSPRAQQQQQQQQREAFGAVSPGSGSISFSHGVVHSPPPAAASGAAAMPGTDHGSGGPSDAAAVADRVAVISAVLQRSRSSLRLCAGSGGDLAGRSSISSAAAAPEQQQQQHWSGQFLEVTGDGGCNSSTTVQQDETKRHSASGSGSGTVNSDRSSLVAAVLLRSRSRSRLSSVETSGAGAQQPASEVREEEWTASNTIGSADKSHSVLLSPTGQQQQQLYASGSVTNSLSGGNSDRASLVAAVLQRHKEKSFMADAGVVHTCSDSTSSGSSIAGVGNRAGLASPTGDSRSAGLMHQIDVRENRSYSRSNSISGGKDRASIVAAVLAQRQQRNSATGGAGGSLAGSSGLEGAASLNGSLNGCLTANNSSNSVGGGRGSSAADRASLVAAVLAKHSTG